MEAFARRQLEKKQSQKLINLVVESPKKAFSTPEDIESFNISVGLPRRPKAIHALGKNESAAIWWEWTHSLEGILGWEILRYRKHARSPYDGEWQYKGSLVIKKPDQSRTIIDELSNDSYYRFTIKAINSKGSSSESEPSNEIIVEQPLPSGWFRFIDPHTQHFYFANLKTKQSSWLRPEVDPYFLDESIVLNFNKRELEFLKSLYIEDIHHFGKINAETFYDALHEVGDSVPKSRLLRYFRAYGNSEGEALVSWQEFMNVMNAVKIWRMTPPIVVQQNAAVCCSFFSRKVVAVITGESREQKKFGDWRIEMNAFADRRCFINDVTHQIAWEMPAEVRFYLPDDLERKLLQVFSDQHLESFRRFFSMLDLDGSGELSKHEMKVFFDSLGLKASKSTFDSIFRLVDGNANGYIEFDEFCLMMYELGKPDRTGIWKEVRFPTFEELDEMKYNDEEYDNEEDSHHLDLHSSMHLREQLGFAGHVIDQFDHEIESVGLSLNPGEEGSVSSWSQQMSKSMKSMGSSSLKRSAKMVKAVASISAKYVQTTSQIVGSKVKEIAENLAGDSGPHGPYCFCGCRGGH